MAVRSPFKFLMPFMLRLEKLCYLCEWLHATEKLRYFKLDYSLTNYLMSPNGM
jgi:hypothetical protein